MRVAVGELTDESGNSEGGCGGVLYPEYQCARHGHDIPDVL